MNCTLNINFEKMDIVNQINPHIKRLNEGLAHSSFEQRKSLTIAILSVYFKLYNFEETIKKHIGININKVQLISDISNNNVHHYKETIEKSNAEIDVYADDYEELEQIEVFILDGFTNAVSDLTITEHLVSLFIGIIDLLDYYENFSDTPEFWNNLLEKEVEFQNDILIKIKSGQTFDLSIYQKRYKEIEFDKL